MARATPPLVSIIVPVRDGERWIDETLDSALGQTYPNIEVIVVDDGSRDRTRAIAEARAQRDSRVRVAHQANRGVAAARNRAVSLARGDLVAPLDADDLWDPAKIERQVQRIASADPSTGLVYSWWAVIDAGGVVRDCSPAWRFEGACADTLAQINFTGNASVPLFRRRALEEVGGYDVTLRERGGEGCEDWDVAVKIAERAPIAVVPEALVAYRRGGGSMSASRDRMWRSFELMTQALVARRPNLPSSIRRRAHDQFALHLAGSAYWSGAYGEAMRWGLRARQSGLAFRALPLLLRMLVRSPRSASVIRAGVSLASLDLPSPLMPYDRIYTLG